MLLFYLDFNWRFIKSSLFDSRLVTLRRSATDVNCSFWERSVVVLVGNLITRL